MPRGPRLLDVRRTFVQRLCGLISAIAPISDQLENLASYWMLANPVDFAAGWAYVNSSFSATKSAFFVFAYVAAPLGLVAGLVSRSLHARRVLR